LISNFINKLAAIGLDNGEDLAFECEIEGMQFIERLLGEGMEFRLKFVEILLGFDRVVNA